MTNGQNQSSFLYDKDAIRQLHQHFFCKLTDFSEWFGVSRQAIHNHLKPTVRPPKKHWQGKEWEPEELAVLKEMIRNHKFHAETDQFTVKLYRHKQKPEFAVVVLRPQGKKVKCFFELPEPIYQQLLEEKYHLYNEVDLQVRDTIAASDMVTIEEGEEVLRFRVADYPDMKNAVTNRVMYDDRFTTQEDYFDFLGFNYQKSNVLTKQEIQRRLSEYVIEGTNQVYIPCKNPKHGYYANMAVKKGFPSMKSFVEHHGFEYRRMRRTDFKERAVEKIQTRYVVDGNKVFIPSHQRFYISLHTFALRRNTTLNEMLKEWGFIRVYRQDLPPGYVPFQEEEEIPNLQSEEAFQLLLDDFVLEDNQIYLNPDSNVYQELMQWAIRKDMTVSELLDGWGYEQIFSPGMEEPPNTEAAFTSNQQDTFHNDWLEKIKHIQGTLATEKVEQEKRARSRQLATELKKLYGYRCQLCVPGSAEDIPVIEKADGTFYVEVHHIIPVSSADTVDDDTFKILDTYQNTVVVCPHHHRVLHYQNGGYSTLVKEEDTLYFQSSFGKKLFVQTNYHL